MDLKVRITPLQHNTMFIALKNGQVDILAHAVYTKSRSKAFDFSPPYSTGHFTLFGRKNAPPIKSVVDWYNNDVMVRKRHTISEIAAEEGWSSITFVNSEEQMLKLLNAGKHDYAIMNKRVGLNYRMKLGLDNITIVTPTPIVLQYCFAVNKGNNQILCQFVKGLDILRQTGEDKKIKSKWLSDRDEHTGIPWAKVVNIGLIAIAVFLVIIFIALLWSRILKKQVVQRTAALSLEITERQRVENELRHNQEQLVQTEKLAALGTFVSGVAHEINNPNGLILMNLSILKEIYEDASHIAEDWYNANGDFEVGKWNYSQLREKLGTILTGSIMASRRIVQIVDDLKDFCRKDTLELTEDVDLNSVCVVSLRLVGNVIQKSTESFNIHYAENLPPIRGNARRIEQVVVNLVLNACQALPDRGKGIKMTTFFDPKQQVAGIEITDEGIGIAVEHLQHITDPFYTTKREQGGTGLGLSVSNNIVKEHRGSLTFRSSVGKGTTVTVSFPTTRKDQPL